MRFKVISMSVRLISTGDLNILNINILKYNTYINMFQGNNFPPQYHALNTVFRCMSLFWNNVAGLHTETYFTKKSFCTHVFL